MEKGLPASGRGISGVLRGVAPARTQKTKLEDPGPGKWVGPAGNGQYPLASQEPSGEGTGSDRTRMDGCPIEGQPRGAFVVGVLGFRWGGPV